MKASKIPIKDISREFDVSELFFSTTDQKGIISTCNDVFVRISAFEASEMIGAPHNIVRHPHMPRCVFKLLWDYLLSGRQIAAYVKNMAKTGEYYWVLALATPVSGGFLSIRLKPTSELLTVVRELYTELQAHEASFGNDWRAGMESAANLLSERLQNLGFQNYDAFMTQALRVELGARRTAMLQRDPVMVESSANSHSVLLEKIFNSLTGLEALKKDLSHQELFLVRLDMQLSRMAINSGVRAAHLGAEGLPLSVIGEEIARVSRQVGEEVTVLRNEVDLLTQALESTTFNVCLAILQMEMSSSFKENQAERNLTSEEQVARFGASSDDIRTLLDGCAHGSLANALEGGQRLIKNLGSFDVFLQNAAKILLTIQFAYVTGKTQAARIDGGDVFAALLNDLVQISESARREFENLSANVGSLQRTIREWETLAMH
jgi:hypothetical protein